MRPSRTLRAAFALLFTLMLPLQGYAAMPSCGPHDPANSSAASTADAPPAATHCARAPAAHHHACGQCCCGAAIVPTPAHWIAPRLIAPEISLAALWPPPTVALDRLDRPPRLPSLIS
jgi:hypothetical protein